MNEPHDDAYTELGRGGDTGRFSGGRFSGGRSGGPSGGPSEPPRRRELSARARRVVLCAMLGAAGALAASVFRGYQLDLALITGVALALLAFAVLRTIDRLRGQMRR